MEELKYEILDDKRKEMLPILAQFKESFILAGGTGLALQIGHRISEDFDFFTNTKFQNEKLIESLKNSFQNNSITQVQNEIDTLTVLVDQVKLSFFYLKEPPLIELIDTEYFKIFNKKEIAIFKILALLRAEYKDYIDLYYLLKEIDIKEILLLTKLKYPDFNEAMYIKALLSFDDIDITPISFQPGFEVSEKQVFGEIKKTISHRLR
ncbi:MAG: nucleotidyl transferase AbiEii/AbiGii toxin family protein [Melioribacteraceae bacterium]|nr:nucleotidyl transferase AbiEii/AbiGii toxin family protein [Melioribacteraceae bacterium]